MYIHNNTRNDKIQKIHRLILPIVGFFVPRKCSDKLSRKGPETQRKKIVFKGSLVKKNSWRLGILPGNICSQADIHKKHYTYPPTKLF